MKIFLLVFTLILWLITGAITMSQKNISKVEYAFAWGTLVCLTIIELIGEIICAA